MKPWHLSSLLLLMLLSLPACKKKSNNPNNNASTQTQQDKQPTSTRPALDNQVLVKRAKQVMKAAFGTLAGKLRKAIKKGGIPAAVKTCSEVAIPTTTEVAKKHKVSLARVSHRPRNPSNQASAEEIKIIQLYMQAMKSGNDTPPTVVRQNDSATVYSPIVLAMPLCLKCHGAVGKDVKKEHYAVIQKHYPKDKAVNFKMGEIRGLWKVTLK